MLAILDSDHTWAGIGAKRAFSRQDPNEHCPSCLLTRAALHPPNSVCKAQYVEEIFQDRMECWHFALWKEKRRVEDLERQRDREEDRDRRKKGENSPSRHYLEIQKIVTRLPAASTLLVITIPGRGVISPRVSLFAPGGGLQSQGEEF